MENPTVAKGGISFIHEATLFLNALPHLIKPTISAILALSVKFTALL
jgi:hypothetical protein